MNDIAKQVIEAAGELRDEVGRLVFDDPVAFVYNPLEYAWEPHVQYIERYGAGRKMNIFLGMNPGPFGMAQTGVPFGEVDAVKNWLGIEAPVSTPLHMHPKRPVEGFDCLRSEVSGRRLWGLFREEFGTADAFFKENFVVNYCPLIWMGRTGANITPDKLPKGQRDELDSICTRHLVRLIGILEPLRLIGVGGFATKRLEVARQSFPDREFIVGSILHPSPASPMANKCWPALPVEQLRELGVI